MSESSQSPSCSILLSYLQSGSLRFSWNIPFSCILDTPPLFFPSTLPGLSSLVLLPPWACIRNTLHQACSPTSLLLFLRPFLHDCFPRSILNIFMSNHSSFIRISKHQLLAVRKDFATELRNCLMSCSAWVTLLEARRKPPKRHAGRHAFTVLKAEIKELTVLGLHKPLSFVFLIWLFDSVFTWSPFHTQRCPHSLLL